MASNGNADARFLKRKVRGGTIDVHPTEKALVVNYELEATILGEMGNPMLADRKECQKTIRVKNLDDRTDIVKLAKEIVDKCKLIHPSKLPEVEHLLHYLVSRKSDYQPQGKTKISEKPADPGAFDSTEVNEEALITDVDDYLEMLYEDVPEKTRASALILQLTRNPDNLEELFSNETLIGALARVLREDWKSSSDLSTNIAYIFFCFSSFSDFHPVILHFKIGALTMNIIENELKKYDMWLEELQRKKHAAQQNPAAKKDFDKANKKFKTLVRKQEQLFRVSFYMLLNIAEDFSVEVKMRNKNIVTMLCKTLERVNYELLILVVSFIKKMSIFKENIDEMHDSTIIERLSKVISTNKQQEDLLHITFRLLLNLSFDKRLREKMVQTGLLQKLVPFIMNENHRLVVLCILYHLSIEDDHKDKFTYTDVIPLLMKMILECPDDRVELETIAVGINLACSKKNAEIIAGGKGVRMLMKRAFKFRDSLILKMLRNMSEHDDLKMAFVSYISDFAGVVTGDEFDEDFQLESLGILANLNVPDLDYELLIKEFNLVEWIRARLLPGAAEDDIVLQVIILVGTICNEDSCARMLADAGIVLSLIDLLNAKQEDDEMVCQIVYVFYQLIFHESTRRIIIQETQAPAYLIDLMHDKNPSIRQVCDLTLDIIAEFEPEWGRRIQLEKFRWHNSQWLDMMEAGMYQEEPGPEDHTDVMQHPELWDPYLNAGASTPEPYERPDNGLAYAMSDDVALDQFGRPIVDEMGRPIPPELLDQYMYVSAEPDH